MPDVSAKSILLRPSLIIPVTKLELDPSGQASALPPLPEIQFQIPNESFGGAKVSMELPLERTKVSEIPERYIYIFGNRLKFASVEHFLAHLLNAHRMGRMLITELHKGVTFHFWNIWDKTLTPYVPYHSDINTFDGNTSATMRIAERLADDMERLAPVIGARTALEFAASELIIYAQIMLRVYKGEKLLATAPDKSHTRPVYILQ